MIPDYVLSPLDVLRASQLAGAEHRIVKITPVGVACAECRRLLTALEWAHPCPGRDGDGR